MKNLSRFFLFLMAMVAAFAIALPPTASAELVRKVDNVIILLDQSGSMSGTYASTGMKKIETAVDIVSRMDNAIPELGYTTGLYLVSPLEPVSPMQTYQNGSLSAAAADIDTNFGLLGRYTMIGNGLKTLGAHPEMIEGKTALIVLTDGDNNVGADPVRAAQDLYDNYPNICIHMVSLADGRGDGRTIQGIRSLSDCSVSADGNSLASDAGMNRFVENVLYGEVAAPVVVPVEVQKEVITFNFLFGFDKAKITGDMIPVLEQLQMIIEDNPDAEFIVAGHTDSVGSEAYNQKLSERRAGAVSNWLTDNDVAADRLEIVGYGESQPKFDNSTEEGRKLNRRVEVMTK